MKLLLVGTRNRGKAAELRDIWRGVPVTLQFPDDLAMMLQPDEAALETGTTFEANAIIKARYFARRSGLPCMGEDSGLEVDELSGAPGIYSARFAGIEGAERDAANNALLLERLAGVPWHRRRARYRCSVVFVASPDAPPHIGAGTTEGHILEAPRGQGGFGYDPLFYSDELAQSFGEAPAADKHRVSHRGRAVRELIGGLRAARLVVGGSEAVAGS